MGAFLLIHLILQPQIVSDHRDKLAISGLSSVILNGVAEIRIERIHVTSVPCDLDCVADGALDAACGGLVLLCDGGVENFCNTIDNVVIIYRHQNRGAEILISFYVRGDIFALFFNGFIALFIGVNS